MNRKLRIAAFGDTIGRITSDGVEIHHKSFNTECPRCKGTGILERDEMECCGRKPAHCECKFDASNEVSHFEDCDLCGATGFIKELKL